MPKPGALMATFRHLLGWPMLATALWLLYVFTNQSSVFADSCSLPSAAAFSFTLWLYGHRPTFPRAILACVPSPFWE